MLDNADISSAPLSDGSRLHELKIWARTEYNQTRIRCLAFVGASEEITQHALLLIQGDANVYKYYRDLKHWPWLFILKGPLSPVNNIRRNLTTLTWKRPFSLDLSNAHPDIVYCVEILNITCRNGDVHPIYSACDVQGEELAIGKFLYRDFIYRIVITPRSNVVGADNGTKTFIDGL